MKIDFKEIIKLMDRRLVTEQKHQKEDLLIYNYSKTAQFDKKNWTPLLRMCRGLIVDGQGNVKARPFDKFFNREEHIGNDSILEPLPKCGFKAYDKLDGSLGITYQLSNGSYALATRGSFISEQAIVGTKMLQEYLKSHLFEDGLTYLFEIIYPENRIVVDYGNKSFIKLIATREIESGKVTPLGDLVSDFETTRDNAEGVVLYYDNGFMCKVKYKEYVRLHRLFTGASEKTIWDLLRQGQDFNSILDIDNVPKEFSDWVTKIKSDLESNYNSVEDEVKKRFLTIKSLPTRKEQATEIMANHKEYSKIIFNMLNGKDYSDIIWKMIRPRCLHTFKEEN
jgi:RNA ligase